jgi:hypothetical protein
MSPIESKLTGTLPASAFKRGTIEAAKGTLSINPDSI